jgi:hypothetical protein
MQFPVQTLQQQVSPWQKKQLQPPSPPPSNKQRIHPHKLQLKVPPLQHLYTQADYHHLHLRITPQLQNLQAHQAPTTPEFTSQTLIVRGEVLTILYLNASFKHCNLAKYQRENF